MAINYQIKGKNNITIKYDGVIQWLGVLENKLCINLDNSSQYFLESYFIRTIENNHFFNQILKEINFDFLSEKNFYLNECNSIYKFLEYFESGNYYVEFGNYELGEFRFPYTSKDYQLVQAGYNAPRLPLMCTLFKSDLNFDTIDKYKVQIKKGLKPIILSYRKDYGSETGPCSYLLDGHHKLMAYNALLIKPNIWEIVNIASDEYNITDQTLCQYLNIKELQETILKYNYKSKYNIRKLIRIDKK